MHDMNKSSDINNIIFKSALGIYLNSTRLNKFRIIAVKRQNIV